MPDQSSVTLCREPQSSRRDILKRLGSGALFICSLGRVSADEEKAGTPKHPLLTSRIHIGDNGIITLLTGKVECGQGIRTTLAQVAAEELRVPIEKVCLLMGDTDLVPDDGGTWGSLTTPQTVPVVREASAAMHALLCRSAAGEWKIDASQLSVINGQIAGPGSRTFGYRDLITSLRLAAAVISEAPVTKASEWKVCGTPIPNVNGPSIVTGSHRYSSDLHAHAMLHGRVLRAPNHHCRLLSLDDSKAREIPGVRVVHEGDFLGVTAPSAESAEAAASALGAQWSSAELGDPASLYQTLKEKSQPPNKADTSRYRPFLQRGSVASGMAEAEHRFNATYRIAYIAHVPLENRTAVAEWKDNRVTVRCGTQAPFLVRDEIARACGLSAKDVRIIVSDTGSGYGGKHSSECELDAVRLAKGAGCPVRLAWSRHEEFTQSYCRPAAVMEVRTGALADGRLVAWDFHNYNGGAASLTPPYQIPNSTLAYHASDSPLRQGSYRSLAAVGNTFARESMIDEVASQLKIDPLELRLRNSENSRLRNVLHRAADRFAWGKHRSGNGRGFGLACNVEKGGHLALFTELETDGTTVRLRRMVAAFDAGAVINPDILSNQVEGAIIQGIGAALFEELRYDKTHILNGYLAQYRVPRFADIPDIEVILIDDRSRTSAGAGESPITTTAPSIASAVFAASGKRIRQLPILSAPSQNPLA